MLPSSDLLGVSVLLDLPGGVSPSSSVLLGGSVDPVHESHGSCLGHLIVLVS